MVKVHDFCDMHQLNDPDHLRNNSSISDQNYRVIKNINASFLSIVSAFGGLRAMNQWKIFQVLTN